VDVCGLSPPNHLERNPPKDAEDANAQANSQQWWADDAADSKHSEIGSPRLHSIRLQMTAATPKTIIIKGTRNENAPKAAKNSVTRKPVEANARRSLKVMNIIPHLA